MATTLLVNGQPSKPLSTRPATRAGGVRKRGESKDQMQQRLGSYGAPSGSDNSDIDAIFRGIQGTRGMVRRGLSGQPLNPDGTDPGNSFDRFMRQNPHLQGAAGRQQQNDQQARNRLDMLFPGNAKSSPPGGANGGRVGPSQAPGEPGGDILMGEMPNVQGAGMPMASPKQRLPSAQKIQYGPRQAVKQDGWESLFSGQQGSSEMMPTNPTSQQNAMSPNERPQLPYGNPRQLAALETILPYMGTQSKLAPALMSALNLGLSDVFPGVPDWEYLQSLFPGLVQPTQGSMSNTKNLLGLLQDPAYRSQLNYK